MFTSSLKPMTLIAGLLSAVLLVGCGKGVRYQHEQNVANSKDRIARVRSNLMLDMAQRQFDAEDLEQAEKTVTEAISKDPKNPKLFVLAGRITLEQAQLERSAILFNAAIELFEQAKKNEPDSAQPYYYLGIINQRWQKDELALLNYSRAYELIPDHVPYLLAKAEMMVSVGKTEDAINLLKEKAVYFDQNAPVRMALAQILQVSGRVAESIEYYRQASMLAPDDYKILENLALAEYEAGRTDAAVRDLERLVQRTDYRDRRDIQSLLGRGYFAQGRLPEARSIFIVLTRSDANDVDAWVVLGQVAWKQEDLKAAASVAAKVIGLAPRRFEGHMLAGLIQHERKQYPQAIRSFETAARLAPDNPAPVVMRGLSLEAAGLPEDAAGAYIQALRIDPNDTRAKTLLTRVNNGHHTP